MCSAFIYFASIIFTRDLLAAVLACAQTTLGQQKGSSPEDSITMTVNIQRSKEENSRNVL
jgi:hypothetical protein